MTKTEKMGRSAFRESRKSARGTAVKKGSGAASGSASRRAFGATPRRASVAASSSSPRRGSGATSRRASSATSGRALGTASKRASGVTSGSAPRRGSGATSRRASSAASGRALGTVSKRTSSAVSGSASRRAFGATPRRASVAGSSPSPRRASGAAPRRTTGAAPRRASSAAPAPTRIKRTRKQFEEVRSQLEDRAIVNAVQRPRPQIYTPKPRKPKISGEVGVRLNRFIANSGICSRREADEYIQQGLISINGQVVTELGTKVFQNDEGRFDNQIIKGEEKVYIVMNKPKNCVTTTDDPHARKTVMDLIAGKCPQRIYPVGRLDRDTTGVLLLTNDGELTEKLTHPSYNKKKIYHVFLDRKLSQADFEKILKGIYLDDGFINADSMSYIDGDQTQLGLEIHSGRNRIVRRIFESLGYRVDKLDRVYFAGLTKKNLRRGQWRFLTDKELAILRMGAYE